MFPKIQKALPNKNWKTELAYSPWSKLNRANTIRKISKKTAQEIKTRDICCIIPKCWMPIDEIHHAFYGIDADYSSGRNDAINLVWLCRWCHEKLHSIWNNEYREYCKNYLKNIWDTNTKSTRSLPSEATGTPGTKEPSTIMRKWTSLGMQSGKTKRKSSKWLSNDAPSPSKLGSPTHGAKKRKKSINENRTEASRT